MPTLLPHLTQESEPSLDRVSFLRLAQRCLTLRRVIVDGTSLKVTVGGFTRGDEDEELSRNTPGPRTDLSLRPADLWKGLKASPAHDFPHPP